MAAAPTRIVGLDVARGLAVLGMFAAHLAPAEREMIWDGRSAVLFAVLAGVSIGLMSGGATRSTRPFLDTASILLRGLYLLVIGVGLTLLGTPIAVILPHYGLMFVVAALLMFLPRAVLAALAAVSAVGGPLLVDRIVTAGNDWITTLSPEDALLARMPLTWLTQYYPVPSWLAYVMLGLLIARCDIRSATTQRWLVIGGAIAAVLGYGVGLALGGPESVEAHSSTTAEIVGAGGVAAVAIGALTALTALAARLAVVRAVTAPLAAVGAMPLTVYSVQLVALAVYLIPYEPFDFAAWQSWTLLASFTVVAVFGALLWRRFVGQGPLEWLVARASLRPRTRAARPALG